METQTLGFLKIAEHRATNERINRNAWMVQPWQNEPAAPRRAVRSGLPAALASLRELLNARSVAPAG